MKALCTAHEMRALDQHAIEDIGIPSTVLMESAGRGAALKILQLCGGNVEADEITLLIGAGNNGGDGLVVARILSGWGAQTTTILLVPPEKLSPDASLNFKILKRLQSNIAVADTLTKLEELEPRIKAPRVLVDALFGTGLSRPLSGRFERACTLAAQSTALKISLDIPSGINATSGASMGAHFPSDHCITFGAMKWGHMLPPGRETSHPLTVIDIGIPPESMNHIRPKAWIPRAIDTKKVLPERSTDAHKGAFGHVLLVAGSGGKAGAAILAGQAAFRAGAGLVTLGSDAKTREIAQAGSPELMTLVGREGSGEEAPLQVDNLLEAARQASVMVLGPGLGRGEALAQSLAVLLEKSTIPAVVDADAIRLMAPFAEVLKKRKGPTILTPHPGEMGALLGLSSGEVQAQRRDCVLEAAKKYASTVILKGFGTLTSTTEGTIYFNPTGGPWLATAGSGDVLAGCIAGLIAQGLAPEAAAWSAVFIHGTTGDRLSKKIGRAGLVASDLVKELPETIESLKTIV